MNNCFSTASSESHSGSSFGQGVSWAFAGMMPSRFWLAKMVSRSLFQPWSNSFRSLILSIHSGVGWCGACVPPGT